MLGDERRGGAALVGHRQPGRQCVRREAAGAGREHLHQADAAGGRQKRLRQRRSIRPARVGCDDDIGPGRELGRRAGRLGDAQVDCGLRVERFDNHLPCHLSGEDHTERCLCGHDATRYSSRLA